MIFYQINLYNIVFSEKKKNITKISYKATKKDLSYSSNIFSKLPYEDLKKAHTETVVPVTLDDFNNKQQFSSVNQFIQYRDGQDTTPLSLQQSQQYLQQRDNTENKISMQRAFSLIKRDIEVEKSNQQWWSNLRTLKN